MGAKNVKWKTSDKYVATVSSSGKVKGIDVGTCTVTATNQRTNKKYSCKIYVAYWVKNATLKNRYTGLESTLPKDLPEGLACSWTSSDPTVVAWAGNQKYYAVNDGKCSLELKYNYGDAILAKYNVTVKLKKKDPNTVHFEEEEMSYIAHSCQLHLIDEHGNDISKQAYWTSDENSIVSDFGYVRMLKYDNGFESCIPTTITASYQGKEYKITLRGVSLDYYIRDNDTADALRRYREFISKQPYHSLFRTSDGSKYGLYWLNYVQDENFIRREYPTKYITESEFAKVLEDVKKKYPDGTYWGDDTVYTSKLGHKSDACAGFVNMVMDAATGTTMSSAIWAGGVGIEDRAFGVHKVTSPSELKLYDMVEYLTSGGTHIVIVIGFTDEGILVCEGNCGSKVSWGRLETYEYLFDSPNEVYAGSFIDR